MGSLVSDENYCTLEVYSPGEYVFSEEDVARAIIKGNYGHNRWADISHDYTHKVISWHSKDGDFVRRKDVYFDWDHDTNINDDINTYRNGLNGDGVFHPYLHARRQLLNNNISQEGFEPYLEKIEEREEHIVNVAKHWLAEFYGKKIPLRPKITPKLIPESELKGYANECAKGNWPEYLVWMGFHRPNTNSGLIPVNQQLRPDHPQYSCYSKTYIGLWEQVQQLAHLYDDTQLHHFTKV